ncbi:MAG TPA: PAS domain S-box protein [Polyangia bacterium]|nr:PAS domain S-box protein [Polyangia bacterium]
MDERTRDPLIWEAARIEELGGAFIAAASAAGIGVSVVSMKPPVPRVVYVSDKGVEIMGHPREELLSRPASAFLTPTERTKREANQSRVVERGLPVSFETTVQRADGREIPLEVALAPIRLDGLPGVIAFLRDVTERRAATDALARSEQRLRQLIEHAPDAVWINDGRRLVFANSTAARMLRYPSVEALLAADVTQIVAPEDQPAMRERMQEMMRTGTSLPPRDYRTLRRDGSSILCEVQAMPIEWEGRPGLLGFARDVTSRKEMEARLAQSERLAALGTLLAGIAHEMNNPLAYALLGIEQAMAQLARLQAPAEEVAKLRETLDSALHGATRVSAVVNQIRASSRPEVGERGPVDVRALLEAALRVTHNEIHHRARLVTDLGDVPPGAVTGNAQRLEQVFLNLLVNAVQALPDGRAENEVRVVLRALSPQEISIEVSDNGPGIPDDARSRIFDPFFTTRPDGLGLGLSLSICHGIVTSHGGTITVDSAPGRGSTFRIVLPAKLPQPAAAARPAAPASGAARRRVLVIDDETALAAMIRRVLSKECDVDLAVDGHEGLERLGAGAYDVVLCDLMMPDMTGMDLFAEVARRHPGVERRFIFMTGGAFTPRATEFLAQVSNRRLEKPFETATLKAAVARDD